MFDQVSQKVKSSCMAIPHLYIRIIGRRPEVFVSMVTGTDCVPVESKIWLNCKPFEFTMFTSEPPFELRREPDIHLSIVEDPNGGNNEPSLKPTKMGNRLSACGLLVLREYTPTTCMDALGKTLLDWYKFYLDDNRIVRRERERMMC